MAASGKGLGKGLSALFGEDLPTGGVSLIRIDDIEPNPDQPRRDFDPESMAALADSIRQNGIITPITLRQTGETYQIIAGERRWRACRMAGVKEIPAIILEREEQDAFALSLIENLQREDLNPIEEAEGFARLTEMYHLTQEQASERVGRSRSAVANSMRLLQLDPKIQEEIKNGRLSAGHGRALLSIEAPASRPKAAEMMIEQQLSVREAEKLAAHLNTPVKEKLPDETQLFIRDLENRLSSATGRKITLLHGKKRGKLIIEYYGNDDLDDLCHLLEKR